MSTALANALVAQLGGTFPECIEGAKLARISLDHGNCVCGHDIGRTFWIRIPEHPDILPIGSTCIKHILKLAGIRNRLGWAEMDANRRDFAGMLRRGQRVMERARLVYSWPVPSQREWAVMTANETPGSAEVLENAMNRLLAPDPTEDLEMLLAAVGHAGLISMELAHDIVVHELMKEERGLRPALQRHLRALFGDRDFAEFSGAAAAVLDEQLEPRRRKCHKFVRNLWQPQDKWQLQEQDFKKMHPGCELRSIGPMMHVKIKSGRGHKYKEIRQPGVLVISPEGRPLFWYKRQPFDYVFNQPGRIWYDPAIVF